MFFCLTVWTATLLAGATLPANSRSVVRTDDRSGRLVRSVVVAPRIVSAVEVRPIPVLHESVEFPAVKSTPVQGLIEDASKRHDVDPLLVESVIKVESNFNARAVSPKGALGLMQLIPATARRFGVKDPFDAQQNIEGGVKYLKYLQQLYGDDRLALAAYNAGEGAVAKYGAIPPYAETQSYVYEVGRRYGQARRQKGRNHPVAAVPSRPETPRIHESTDAEGRIHLSQP